MAQEEVPQERLNPDRHEGGCICGAVRFRASGPPNWVVWCHCASCRRHSGAPASAYASFPDAAIEILSGEITKFASSPPALRGFCARCGSTLTAEVNYMPGELHFHIGAFDEPERLAPMAEAFPEERMSWMPPTGVVALGQPS